jgi:hypothetical protein
MKHTQVTEESAIQIRKNAASVFNESPTTDKGWSAVPRRSGIDQVATFPHKASDLNGLVWNCLNNGNRTRRKYLFH